MKHIPVKSTNISSVAYDEKNETLEIKFTVGKTYRYAAVPPKIYGGLLEAESAGGFFHKYINGKFKSIDITGLDKENK